MTVLGCIADFPLGTTNLGRDIYAQLPAIMAQGSSLVIVEQDIAQALKAAAQVYCLQEGRVALQGAARDLTQQAIAAAYFGG